MPDDRAEPLRRLEALLFVSDEPVTAVAIAAALEIERRDAEELCEELARRYEERDAGIVLRNVAVTRHQVSSIRGVNSDGVLRALSDRGLVAEGGRDERPGRPVLFGTTPEFLERIGLPSLSALPPLAPLLGNGDGTLRASLGEGGGDGDVTPDDGAESSTD
jgi:segregation and condensation protein B